MPCFWPDETDDNPNVPNYNVETPNNYVGDESRSCKASDAFAVADKASPGRRVPSHVGYVGVLAT